LSAIFYFDSQQKSTAKDVIEELKHMDYSVATQLYPMSRFWPAEDYHQDYYTKTGKQPYCHVRKKIFK
jgi:peptide methionine sulfoxide reductase msrA/msrB